jgi:DNA mismatch endonuclease, patch repair protein
MSATHSDMPDKFSKAERSRVMAAVKSCNTKPEMIVRRLIHRLGFRFRLYRRDLPGTPDIVLRGSQKIINVHGCFWHMHTCQRKRKAPVNHADYWQKKRQRNVARDLQTLKLLRRQGWKILIIWECQTRDTIQLSKRLTKFLSKPQLTNK